MRQVQAREGGRLRARIALHLLAQVHHHLVVEERRVVERDLLRRLRRGSSVDGARAPPAPLSVQARACPWASSPRRAASRSAVCFTGLPSTAASTSPGWTPACAAGLPGHHAQHGHALVQQRVHGDEAASRAGRAWPCGRPRRGSAGTRRTRRSSRPRGRGRCCRRPAGGARPCAAASPRAGRAIRKPCTSSAAASFSVTLRTRSASAPAAGQQALARQLLGLEDAVDGLARRGHEVEAS